MPRYRAGQSPRFYRPRFPTARAPSLPQNRQGCEGEQPQRRLQACIDAEGGSFCVGQSPRFSMLRFSMPRFSAQIVPGEATNHGGIVRAVLGGGW